VTTSRRHLFALLGLVLPVAAFTASPVAAATSSTMHNKSHSHHASATHKAKPHHSTVHTASHHTTHHVPKPTAS
jgi:hypothetical protein